MTIPRKAILILFISSLIIGILSACSTVPKTPSDVAEAFFRDVKAGQYERAFNLYIDGGQEIYKEMKEDDEFDKWDRMLRDVTFTVLEENIDGDEAKVRYKIYDKRDDDTDKEHFDLIKVDGKWKIDPDFL